MKDTKSWLLWLSKKKAEQKEKANDEEWQSADSEDEEDIETDDGSVCL